MRNETFEILLFVKTIKFVLAKFSDNLFIANHTLSLSNSLFIVKHRFKILFPDANKLVSSANRTNFKISETFFISLMYVINNKGPRIEPCGTPQKKLWIIPYYSYNYSATRTI